MFHHHTPSPLRTLALALTLTLTSFLSLTPTLAPAQTSSPIPNLTLLSASSRGNPNGVLLAFSLPLDPDSALNTNAYQLSGTPIHLVRFGSSQNLILLDTDRLIEQNLYSVTANNLTSTDGIPLTPTPSTTFFEHGLDIPGTYIHNFNDSQIGNATAFGAARLRPNPDDGFLLELTPNSPNQQGSLILNDINADKSVYRFDARFDVHLASAGTPGGEGLSFCFAPDLPLGSFNEEGAGTGLTISFDTLGDNPGQGPSIDVKVGGIPVAQRPFNFPLRNTFVPVQIRLDPDGTLDVQFDGNLVYSDFPTDYPPQRGRFGLGARTGNSPQNHWIDNLEIRLYSELGPIRFLDHPLDRVADEGQIVTFKATAEGTPPHCFQWQVDGVSIPGAIEPDFTLTASQDINGRTFGVIANNEFSTATSHSATLLVTNDATPPRIVKVAADPSFRRVIITFSEPVLATTANNSSNYSIPGLSVFSSTLLPDQTTVHLATSNQSPGSLYHLGLRNIQDTSSNGNTINPDTSTRFSAWIIHPGLVLIEFYDNLPSGPSIDLLTSHPRFPSQPDLVILTNTLATPFNRGDVYGARISGYFHLPNFSPDPEPQIFFARGDDRFRFRFSSDQDPASAVTIIDSLDCCQPFSANPSAPQIVSQAPRYFEGLLKESFNNDFLQIAVKGVGSSSDPDNLPSVPSRFLSTAANPDTAGDLVIVRQPETLIRPAGQTATFRIVARSSINRPLFHQWQRKTESSQFQDIPGANAPSHTTPPLTLNDGRSAFRCVVSVPGRITTSEPATLYVTPDRSPPQLIGVSSTSPFLVDVCFQKTLDPNIALMPANYQVEGASVILVNLHPNGRSVQLSLSQAVPNPRVTVNHLADTEGNTMLNEQSAEGITWASSRDVGNPRVPGASFSCRPNDVEVLAGGADFWGNRDEFRFVYLRQTNDFDVQVRVEQLEPTGTFAKAGLMARESLADNSQHISAYTTPHAPDGAGTYEATTRTQRGGPTFEWGSRPPTLLPNAWVRLQRIGNLFTAFFSSNGSDWTAFASITLVLGPELFVGMATTSQDPDQLTLAHYREFQFLNSPTIVTHPQGKVVNPGVSHTFSVLAGGGAPVSYQWRRNGENIPGASERLLTINTPSPKDGGIYDVIVSSPGGAVRSNPAELIVLAPKLPFSDHFGAGLVVNDLRFTGSGENALATVEPDEPSHAKFGGASVWLSWFAEFTGVVTFSTRGSSFDTLLAAYTSSPGNPLSLVDHDDDSGGFASSTITFNAEQGTLYHIAVDGFDGARGNIVLCWDFQTELPAPRIFQNPVNQVVRPNEPINFAIDIDGATGLQWFRNNQPILGANDAIFQIPSVDVDNVGSYFVEVTGPGDGRIIRSKIAYLELGSLNVGITEDKLEDLFRTVIPGGGSGGSPPGLLVAAGTIDSRILNNANSTTSPGEPSHCGVLGGATRWFGPLYTPDPGMTFEINTLGSAINTILAVYVGPNLLFLTNVACAVGPGNASTVRFPALPEQRYDITVDGTNGTTGTIVLNYKLGSLPVFSLPLTNHTALPGAAVTFNSPASGTPAPTLQWQFDGVDIPGATNITLNLTSADADDTGLYSVIASNFMGTATNSATLMVGHPFFLGAQPNPTNATLLVCGPTNELATNTYLLQATVDFSSWNTIWTNTSPLTISNYFDTDSLYFPHRFYRAFPWP